MRNPLLLLLAAFLLFGCGSEPTQPSLPPPLVQAEILDLGGELKAQVEAMDQIWSQVTDSTVVHVAVNSWKSVRWNRSMMKGMRARPGASLYFLTAPEWWDHLQDVSSTTIRRELRALSQEEGQIYVENDRNPRAGKLGQPNRLEDVQLQSNFILFSHLRRPDRPEASPALLYLGAPVDFQGLSPFAYGLLIRGDLGMYHAYLNYWKQLAESTIEYDYEHIWTYSDRHDHRVSFFPHPAGIDSSTTLMENMIGQVLHSGKPAKFRLYAPRWDDSHLELARALHRMVLDAEADVRIICADTPWIHPSVREQLLDFPDGTVRWDSSRQLAPFSVLHGPVALTSDAIAERKKLVLLGSHPWSREGAERDSNTSLAIFNTNVADSLEAVWKSIWSLAPPLPETDTLEID